MNRPLIVGIAGAIIVLGAIALTFFIDREPDRPVQQGATSPAGTSPAGTSPASSSSPSSSPASSSSSSAPSSTSRSTPAAESGQRDRESSDAGAPSKSAIGPCREGKSLRGRRGSSKATGSPDKPTFRHRSGQSAGRYGYRGPGSAQFRGYGPAGRYGNRSCPGR